MPLVVDCFASQPHPLEERLVVMEATLLEIRDMLKVAQKGSMWQVTEELKVSWEHCLCSGTYTDTVSDVRKNRYFIHKPSCSHQTSLRTAETTLRLSL